MKVKSLSCARLLAIPWTGAHQAPLSMGFSRQEYGSGVPSKECQCYRELLVFCVCAELLSHAQLFVTLWAVACQAPLSMGLSRQEHWSGLPFPSPGDLSDPGTELPSPALAGRRPAFTTETPGKPSQKPTIFQLKNITNLNDFPQ